MVLVSSSMPSGCEYSTFNGVSAGSTYIYSKEVYWYGLSILDFMLVYTLAYLIVFHIDYEKLTNIFVTLSLRAQVLYLS